MAVWSAIPLLGGVLERVFDRVLPDKAKVNEADGATAVRRVHEATFADVDADVADPSVGAEEHEVA